jgi:hypothetical protein
MDLAGGYDRHVDAGLDVANGMAPGGVDRTPLARLGQMICRANVAADVGAMPISRGRRTCWVRLALALGGSGQGPLWGAHGARLARWAACMPRPLRRLCRGRSREPAPRKPRPPSRLPIPKFRGSFLMIKGSRMRGSAVFRQSKQDFES